MIPLLSSILAVAWLIVTQPAVAQASNWSSAYRDPTNRNAVIEQPTLPLTQAGTIPNKFIRPVVEGDILVTAESTIFGQRLVGHQLSTLKPLWDVPLGSDIPQQPVIHQGTIYFGLVNRPVVLAVDLLNGQKRWQQSLTGETYGVRFAPVVIDNYLFVPSAKLHRLSTTGEYQWSQFYMVASPMATDGETLFIRVHQQSVIALNPTDGQARWSYPTNTTWGTAPVVTADSVYLGTYQQILALDKTTGLKRWHYTTPLSSPLIVDLATAGNRLFVSTNAGDILSFNATGQLVWHNQFNSGSYSGNGWQARFVLAGDRVLAQADWTAHIVIDALSGQTLFNGRLGDVDGPVLAVSEERLLIGQTGQIAIMTAANWSLGTLTAAPPTAQRDPVVIIPGIMGSWSVNGVWQIDPVLHTFDQLLTGLRTAGYIDNQTLFSFPYDWHQSNTQTAQLLASKIATIRAQTGAKRVDIVAHSMGGLVSRAYIQGDNYQNDVNQLITLGTPHQGSVKSYLTWEAGQTGSGAVDTLKEKLMAYEAVKAGYGSRVVDYIQAKVPTIGQLLPTFDYLEKSIGLVNYQPCLLANYPCNPFLEGLNSQLDRLVARVKPLSIRGQLPSDTTLKQLKVTDSTQTDLWSHGMPLNYPAPDGLISGAGDGTVLTSATQLTGIESLTLSADHTQLVTLAAPIIVQRLTGKTVAVDQIIPPKKFLLVRLFSPIDMLLIDPLGRRLGTDPTTGQLINAIPNGFYSGNQTDLEYTIIADPIVGQYQLQLIGTGEGSYQVVSSLIDESTTLESTQTASVMVGQELGHVVQVGNDQLIISPATPLACRPHPSPKKECKKEPKNKNDK